MADVSAVNSVGSTHNVTLNKPPRIEAPAAAAVSTDLVEFSEVAQLLGSLEASDQAPIRAEKVSQVREAIAQGRYETEDKIDYVVSRLMDVLALPSGFVD